MSYRVAELIAKKRDGRKLSKPEIDFLVSGFSAGEIPDYQVAAWLMAAFLRGLDGDETAALLDAMQRSGDVVTWEDLSLPTADKHSTGGVGDKVSIPLAPAVAACGVAVPMISGRGLGHTGGTLDKLESIPGPGLGSQGAHFTTQVGLDDFKRITADVGACMIGQTERIVPADRKLYALRDVTSTVESIPLITASIMSKKLAEGVSSLVLDVKVGSGAFMKNRADADVLARSMVDAGIRCGRKVTAFLTAMDRPLGTHIGNALEIVESVQILRGAGPADTRELVCLFGGEMLHQSGVVATLGAGRARIAAVLDDGSALAVFRRMVVAQGGDPAIADDPEAILPRASTIAALAAWRDGTITRMDALAVGLAAVRLGAGRDTVDDVIDASVGFVLARRPGDRVRAGEPLVWIHAASTASLDSASAALREAIDIGDEPAELQPLVLGVLRGVPGGPITAGDV